MFNGYKCFNKGLTNRYNLPFEVGKTYHTEGEIIFGNDGNGFHVCKRLEDTLRYFDAMDDEVDICQVTCYGKFAEGKDDYNEYYDMYAFEYLKIDKQLTREEIINYGLNLPEHRAGRFISLYRLTKEEIALFKQKYVKDQTVLDILAYYQEGNKEVFTLKRNL